MVTFVRRFIAVVLFMGAVLTLTFIPVNDDLTPATSTAAETFFLVQMLILTVLCLIGGFVALPRGNNPQ